MTHDDWENIARCARERFKERMTQCRNTTWWWGDWESWMAAQELALRSPF